MRVTLTNNFHNTHIQINIQDGGVLSSGQMARVTKELCGIPGCSCGIIRGPQPGGVVIEAIYPESYRVYIAD